MSKINPVVECLRCGDLRSTRGRGLCQRCHFNASTDGTLDQYPLLRSTGDRPDTRPCTWCGRMCRSKNAACTACQKLEAGLDQVPDPDDALTDGRWVVVAGVSRWIPTEREATAA